MGYVIHNKGSISGVGLAQSVTLCFCNIFILACKEGFLIPLWLSS